MSATFYHLAAADYPTHFPDALDEVPVLIQKKTFIDAWIFIRMFTMVQTLQQYCIDNKDRIEA